MSLVGRLGLPIALLPVACGGASTSIEDECPAINDQGLVAATFTVPPRLKDPAAASRAIERERRRASLPSNGSPRVWFTLDTRGVVRSTSIYESSGDPDVDSVAVRSARHFRFHPAYKDNVPVCASVAFFVAIEDG